MYSVHMNTSQIVAHNTYKRRTYTRFSQFSIKSLIIQKDLQSRSKHHDNKHHGWHICVYAIHVIDVLLISISLSNHNLACHSLVFFLVVLEDHYVFLVIVGPSAINFNFM